MVEIKSKKIQMVAVEKIVPNPRNVNRHSIEQIERLSKIIDHNGFRVPLIVSNRSGFLITGHARLECAINLGIEKLPVIYQDFDSEAEEFQFLTADNEIARWAELDWQAVYETLEEIELPKDFDIDLMGIENFKVNPDKDLSEGNREFDTENFGNDLEHKCPKCGFSFTDKK